MSVEPVDLLLVSPGTTPGWRRADAELRRALEALGMRIAACTSDYRIVRHLRRTALMTDLAEAFAMRRATTRALRRYEPRWILYSSSQAAMLQPRARLEGAAVRFDLPAAVNRRAIGDRLLHALERRALRSVRLLLPIGLAPGELQAVPGVDTPMVAFPVPVAAPEERLSQRERVALTYAGNPEKKGLDVAARAWGLLAPTGWRLRVTGIEADAGGRFLAGRGIAEPPGLEWAGVVEPARYQGLLARSTLFVSASRYEDYGLAQLEALAAGAMLVTTPSDGLYEALRIQRELDPRLVASESSPEALAGALRVAISLSNEERLSYRRRAREHLRPYSHDAVAERLEKYVLPRLLAG